MAIYYSHLEWFVPSFQDFIDPKRKFTRRCVWHKSRRAPKRDGGHLVRCSCSVGDQDSRKADQLFKELQSVQYGGTQCLKFLKELSPLLLCRHHHQASNAGEISDFWVAELEACYPAQEKSTQNPKTSTPQSQTHQISSDEVLRQLHITVGGQIKCHGEGKKPGGCGNWISKINGDRITAISVQLAGDWCLSSTALKLLEELSGLVLCKRFHQDQAHSKLKDWTTRTKSKEASRETCQRNETTDIPHTPTRQTRRSTSDIETPPTRTSSVWTTPRHSRSPQSTTTTPDSHLPVVKEWSSLNIERRREQSSVSPTRISRQTRSMTTNRPKEAALLPNEPLAFIPMLIKRSPIKVAECVMKKIKQDISSAELRNGFVYGFRRPGCSLIKIGTTKKTVSQRLHSVGSKCNYTPIVVFEVSTKHAMKVERLVHRQLYLQKRYECLVDGRCNNGAGCSTQHAEWFEGVSDEEAESITRGWARWIDLKPYDEDGRLKQAWLAQTKLFDLNAGGDNWMRWRKINVATEVKQCVKEEVIDTKIKIETVLDAVLGSSSQYDDPLKSEFSVSVREITEDVSDSIPVGVLA